MMAYENRNLPEKEDISRKKANANPFDSFDSSHLHHWNWVVFSSSFSFFFIIKICCSLQIDSCPLCIHNTHQCCNNNNCFFPLFGCSFWLVYSHTKTDSQNSDFYSHRGYWWQLYRQIYLIYADKPGRFCINTWAFRVFEAKPENVRRTDMHLSMTANKTLIQCLCVH